jgi:hypothetical protein
MKKALLTNLLFLVTIVFVTAAVPPSKNATPALVKSELNAKVTSKTSYSEMKLMAENIKGQKLSLQEKVSLNIAAKAYSSSKNSAKASGSGGKSLMVAIVLCVLVGVLGIHRFYMGYTLIGIIQLLTFGVFGIWTLIDLIMLATGSLTPKNGDFE